MNRYLAYIPLVAALIWCYASDITRLFGRWWGDPDYIYGLLVIPFSVLLLYMRRSLARGWSKTGNWWGFGLIVFSILLRGSSAYMSDPVFGPMSIIPCLAGIVLLLGGWAGLHWAWPSVVFLVFMIPLPDFLDSWGNLLLQRVATVLSTYLLQTVGIASVAYGNVIVMADGQLSVAEACSGLRSTMLFFAVSVGAAFLVRGVPEKIAVLLSAIPAAVAANVLRITLTGILHELAGKELADAVFHDFFGFVMLPIASMIVWGEIIVIRGLLVEHEQERPLPIGKEQLAR